VKIQLPPILQSLKRWLNVMFPRQLKELRYVDVTITRECGGWTDARRYGKSTYRRSWKYKVPDGYAEVESRWYIGRFWERKVGFLKFRGKMISVELESHEIDAHFIFGDPWPKRLWDTWRMNGLEVS